MGDALPQWEDARIRMGDTLIRFGWAGIRMVDAFIQFGWAGIRMVDAFIRFGRAGIRKVDALILPTRCHLPLEKPHLERVSRDTERLLEARPRLVDPPRAKMLAPDRGSVEGIVSEPLLAVDARELQKAPLRTLELPDRDRAAQGDDGRRA
jgi:hypothetical protein